MSSFVDTCKNGTYSGWMDVFHCIPPQNFFYWGLALSLGLSIIGAAW